MGNASSYESLLQGAEGFLGGGFQGASASSPTHEGRHSRWKTVRAYSPEELELRRKALAELISSEKSYVSSMEVIVDVFLCPLEVWVGEGGGGGGGGGNGGRSGSEDGNGPTACSQADLRKIFLNVKQLAQLNRQFAADLEASSDPRQMLECLLQFAPFFKMYSTYLGSFEEAASHLTLMENRSSHFACFVRACELQKECKNLRLRDFLIMPVQRIPRYSLLLQSIQKHTKDGDPLRKRIEESIFLLRNVTSQLNSSIELVERRNRVLELQYQFAEDFVSAGRTFILNGTLRKYCRNGPKAFEFVLFSDLLVYGSDSFLSKFGRQQYKMNRSINLRSHFFVVDGMRHGLFMILSPEKSFLVQAPTDEVASRWVSALRSALADLVAPPESTGASATTSPRGRFGAVRQKTRNTQGTATSTAVSSGSPKAKKNTFDTCTLWIPTTEDGIAVTRQTFKLPRAASMQAPLKQILASKPQRDVLRRHMEETYCDELLKFWESATKWTVAASGGRIDVSAAKGIVDCFIRTGSSDEINIAARTRESCVARCNEGAFSEDIFRGCLVEVRDLMLRDVLPKFMASGHLCELLAMLGGKQLPCGALSLDDLILRAGSEGAFLKMFCASKVDTADQQLQLPSSPPSESLEGGTGTECLRPPSPPPSPTPAPTPTTPPRRLREQPGDSKKQSINIKMRVGKSGLGMTLGEGETGRAVVRGFRPSAVPASADARTGGGESLAEGAGVHIDDVLLICNGCDLPTFQSAVSKLSRAREGELVELTLQRGQLPRGG